METEKGTPSQPNGVVDQHLSVAAQVIVALMSLLFSLCAVFGGLGWELYKSGHFSLSALKDSIGLSSICLWVVVAVALFLLLRTLFNRLDGIVGRLTEIRLPGFLLTVTPSWTLRSIITCSLLVFVFWIPFVVVFFPGVLTYDSMWALLQDLGSGALPMFIGEDGNGLFSNHKPVLHTWILGLFLNAGGALGSQTAGIFMFTLLQMACTAAALAVSCCYLERVSTPRVVRLVLLVFCMLFPFFPIYADSCFNDAAFSWVYVVWAVCVAEIARTRAAVMANARFVVLFAVCGVLLACLKNPGIYLVVISIVLLLLVYRRQVFGFLSAAVLPILVALVLLPALVYPLCGVTGTSSREAFGVLYQMTASYVATHNAEVTESQRNAIDNVLMYDDLATTFSYETQDPVKTLQRDNVSTEDLFAYVATWAQMGLAHPESYVLPFVIAPAPFFCPQTEFMYYDDVPPKDIAYYVNDVINDHPSAAQTAEGMTVSSSEAMYDARQHLRNAIDAFHGIPLLGLLFGLGLWASWMPLITSVGVALRRKAMFPAFIPVILSLLLLLISPWAMARYALPLVYTFPLMAGLLLSKAEDSSDTL